MLNVTAGAWKGDGGQQNEGERKLHEHNLEAKLKCFEKQWEPPLYFMRAASGQQCP